MRISDWSSDVCSSDLDLLAFEDRIAHPLGNLGDAVGVEIEAERILPRHQPAFGRLVRQMELPALAVFEQAIAAMIADDRRSEEHTSELQSLMRISYAVFCLKKKKIQKKYRHYTSTNDIPNKQST